jgi:hypothetical protein
VCIILHFLNSPINKPLLLSVRSVELNLQVADKKPLLTVLAEKHGNDRDGTLPSLRQAKPRWHLRLYGWTLRECLLPAFAWNRSLE